MKKILFYVSYALIIMHNMFRSVSFLNPVFSNIVYVAALIALALLSMLNFDHSKPKKILTVIVITLLLTILTVVTRDVFLLTIWLLVISFKDLNFDKLVKYDIILKLSCFCIVMILYGLGLTNSAVMYRDGVMRLSFGFDNPNVFSTYIMSILTEILYLRRNKLNIFDIFLIMLSSSIILIYADSRTPFIAIVLISIFLFVNKYKKRKRKKENKLMNRIGTTVFAIMTCISLVLVMAYIDNPESLYMTNLNKSLSGRLNISSRIIKNHGVSLISDGTFVKDDEATIDNQFIYIMLIYGVIPLILANYAMFKYLEFLDKKQKREIYLIMIALIICGIAEKFCLRIQYDIFVLYASHMIYPRVLESRKESKRSKEK